MTDQPTPETTPRTHDFGPGRRFWGHDYSITKSADGGQQIRASGWGCDGYLIKPGDYLLMEATGGKRATRYQVTKIERVMDPPDMWHAELSFAPRTYATQAEKDADR
ncbi:hypothetical protein [Streptomyces sp900116325]|uniref:hypothetical protein n=1 Tax=Streptomyces sp. 900116325 TaxID=3154295 RepID=UPI0033CABFF7